jgi:chorismate lyase/3-hydroxybenzoate synthase
VENPRQTPSYRYSKRYGDRPPCFARATQLGSRLFIGGTASILGEESRHDDNLEAQMAETCRNLAALIDAAAGDARPRPLAALRSLRAHVRDQRDGPAVQDALDRLTPQLADLEIVQAPLCRRELLVEIEGVAEC